VRLIYTANGPKKGQEVKVGDRVATGLGEEVKVMSFCPGGKVSVKHRGSRHEVEYHCSVIGAEWVEREERGY
jgi:hypothetical protein